MIPASNLLNVLSANRIMFHLYEQTQIMHPQIYNSLTDKVLVHIVGSSSNNSNFTEQRKGDTVNPAHKVVNVLVTSRFLLPKLVAGECQHIKVIWPQVPLELLQVFVVLLSEATFTGYIYHQGHLKTEK